jgi:hypothetical protein
LAISTLINLSIEMLKISKNDFFKRTTNLRRKIEEYFIFRHGKCDESSPTKQGICYRTFLLNLTFATNSPTILYLLIGCPFLAQCTLSWLALQSALSTTCIARGYMGKRSKYSSH